MDNAAPQSPSDGAASSGLSSYVRGILQESKTNRVKTQKKWLRNYAAANVDDNFDPDTWKQKESKKKKTWKSDSYLDVTRQKITAFLNLSMDVLFKGGRVPFMLQPDPLFLAQGADSFAIDQSVELNQAMMHRQFTSMKAIKECERLLLSGCVYGEYYAKRYTSDLVEERHVEAAPGVLIKQVDRKPMAAFEQKSIWNIWWERESGDISKAEYVFERTMSGHRDVRRLLSKNPFIIKAKLKEALDKSGNRTRQTQTPADTSTLPPGERNVPHRTRPIELYEGWLWVPRDDADNFEIENQLPREAPDPEAAAREGQDMPAAPDGIADDAKDSADRVYVACWMIDGEIVGYCREPGDNPYFGEQFEECIDSLYGRGIADNIEAWQKGLNGAVRSFENNTKLIANLIVAVKRELLKSKPEDAIDEGGIIEVDAECSDVRQAVQQVAFQDITGPLIKSIEMFSNFADLASNMPRVQQGQQSDNPQTAFELNQRLQQSGKYVGARVSNFDKLIAWAAQGLYDRNMADPESGVPKIPCSVKALGFTSFENQYMRLQKLVQMIQMVLSDASGQLAAITKLRWLWEEIGKANDLETAQYIKSTEEMRQEQAAKDAAQQPPPIEPPAEDPLIQVNAAEKLAKARKYEADAAAKETDTALKAHAIQPGTHPGMRGVMVHPRKKVAPSAAV